MEVVFTTLFNKDLNQFKKNKPVQDDIFEAIENMEEAEILEEIRELKMLNRAKNSYRVRIGKYRICFRFYSGKIQLHRVGHRDIVYKTFP